MANNEMNVLKVGNSEFEIADAQARQDVSNLKDELNGVVEYQTSKNLYNPSDQNILNNTYMYPAGNTMTVANRIVTGFIPVIPGKKVVMSRFNGATQQLEGWSSICFFSEDKSTVVSGGEVNTNGLTVPDDAYYARVTIATSLIKVQIELADSLEFTTYEAYYDPIPKIKDGVEIPLNNVIGLNGTLLETEEKLNAIGDFVSPNVLNMDAITSGYMSKTGATGSAPTLFFTDYISVKKGDVIDVVKLDTTSTVSMRFVTAFNSEKIAVEASGAESTTKYVVPEGIDYLRITLFVAYANQMLLKNYVANRYIEYGEEILENNVVCYLPKDLYIVTNRDYEIYNKQVCPSAENMVITWSDGTVCPDRIRIKKTTVGASTLVCSVYDLTGNLVSQKTTTIHAIEQSSSPVYLLPLGDSLTNHCVWEAELMNINSNIICVGGRSRNVQNASEVNVTVYDEGRAGFTAQDYLSGSPYTGTSDVGGDETPHNWWWDSTNEEFSMYYYMNNHFPNDQTPPNCMSIFLGMNDLMTLASISTIVQRIKDIIDNVRSYNPTLKLVIITPQIRFLGRTSSAEWTRFIKFAETVESLCADYTNICYLPLLIGVDSVNNYNMTNVTINTRNPEIQQRCTDITHPADYGYWQFADWIDGAVNYLMQ